MSGAARRRRRWFASVAFIGLLAGSSSNCSCPAAHRAAREGRVQEFREEHARNAATRVELIAAWDDREPFPSYLRPDSGWSSMPNNEVAELAARLELQSDRVVVAVERFLSPEGSAWWVYFDANGYVLDAHHERGR